MSAGRFAWTSAPLTARQLRARIDPERPRSIACSTIASMFAWMPASRADRWKLLPAARTTSGWLNGLSRRSRSRRRAASARSSPTSTPPTRTPLATRSARLTSTTKITATDTIPTAAAAKRAIGLDGMSSLTLRGGGGRGSLYATPSPTCDDCRGSCRSDGSSAAKQRVQSRRKLAPVAPTDDVLLFTEVAVPWVDDRRNRDPVLDGAGEVLRAVVDQQLDADLDAAPDFVVGAMQVVEGQANLLQPAFGGIVRAVIAVTRD